MGTLFAYSLAVSVVMMTVWAGYACLRGGTPASRRLILLSGYMIALVGPLTLPLFEAISEAAEGPVLFSALTEVNIEQLPTASAISAQSPSAILPLLFLYIIGVATVMMLTLCDVVRIARICCVADKQRFRDRTVYISRLANLKPFSFGKFIAVSRADVANDAILEHEASHLRRHHSADMLLVQILLILCWYCPAVWALRRRLQLIHEFQADSDVIGSGAEVREYALLLVRRASSGPLTDLTNGLGRSDLQRRIKMLTQPRNPAGRLKNLIPAVALSAVILISVFPAIGSTLNEVSRTTLADFRSDSRTVQYYVIYGCKVPEEGRFVEYDTFTNSDMKPEDVDGVVLSRAGAIFITKRETLKLLAPGVCKFLVDGKMMTPKKFYARQAYNVNKIVVSGRVAIVHSSDFIRESCSNHLQNAINANQ